MAPIAAAPLDAQPQAQAHSGTPRPAASRARAARRPFTGGERSVVNRSGCAACGCAHSIFSISKVHRRNSFWHFCLLTDGKSLQLSCGATIHVSDESNITLYTSCPPITTTMTTKHMMAAMERASS